MRSKPAARANTPITNLFFVPPAFTTKRDRPSPTIVQGVSDIALVSAVLLVTMLILRLSEGQRDVGFVFLTIVGLMVALRHFATAWMLFVASLPFIQLQGSL